MSRMTNVLFASLAAGLLLLGLIALVPEPARAVYAHAPIAELEDTGSGFRIDLTTDVVIPAGEFIPLSWGQVRVSQGALALDAGSLLEGDACAATVTVLDATPTAGSFSGKAHVLVPNDDGYGYHFGTGYDVSFGDYGYGHGLGYGLPHSDITVTVRLEADGCISAEDFAGEPSALFNLQAVVGGDADHAFPSLATTVLLRNLGFAFTTPGVFDYVSSFQTGNPTLLRYGFLSDGGSTVPADADGVFHDLDVVSHPILAGVAVHLQLPLLEGTALDLAFADGSDDGLTSPPFGIDPAVLTAQARGVLPAGFLRVHFSGLPTGVTASEAFDLRLTLTIPESYFDRDGGRDLAPGSFRLLRFTDAGALPATGSSPTCVRDGSDGDSLVYVCTITDFSSFAMVASLRGGGGGGGEPTGSPGSGTGTPGSGTGNPKPTGGSSQTLTPNVDTGKKSKTRVPGLELPAIVAAVGVALVLVRRKL